MAKLLRRKEVEEKTTLCAVEIYARIRRGSFPKQIQISPQRVAWLEQDIDSWIEEQKTACGHVPWGEAAGV